MHAFGRYPWSCIAHCSLRLFPYTSAGKTTLPFENDGGPLIASAYHSIPASANMMLDRAFCSDSLGALGERPLGGLLPYLFSEVVAQYIRKSLLGATKPVSVAKNIGRARGPVESHTAFSAVEPRIKRG